MGSIPKSCVTLLEDSKTYINQVGFLSLSLEFLHGMWGPSSHMINKVDEDENFAGLILKGIGSHMQRPLGMFGILELEKYFQQGSKHD
jgi:hypothetical protein